MEGVSMARILIVDDSIFQRANLRAIVREGGHDSTEAGNGRQALAMIAADPPDLLLIDLIMPEMNGMDILETLREQRSRIPVIVVTADIQDTVRQECLALGAAAVLHKPPQKEALLAAINTALPDA
jgi:CheY-like chemotaxis protein